MDSWNDDRLDELVRRMDAGFDRVVTKEEMAATKGEVAAARKESTAIKEEMRRGFDIADREFGRLNDRLDKLGHTILGVFGAFAATGIAAFIGNATL